MIACLSLPLVSLGCDAKKEEVKPVSWFRDPANKAVLDATLKECRDNPGQLRDTPNCINARKAFEENFLKGGTYQKVREPTY